LQESLNEPLLVPDQKAAYNAILHHVEENKGGIFFLDAPGETGKTFILNLLLEKIRQRKQIALAVASSEIDSTLLRGGKTAQSAFKLPLNLGHGDHPVCDISKESGQAKVLQKCTAIIWDECTVVHKEALEALYHTLEDLRGSNDLMGGCIVVLAGDHLQKMPIIPRSTPVNKLNACLKATHL
jgi:ATP-dependent DNA helicase PIF1